MKDKICGQSLISVTELWETGASRLHPAESEKAF